LLRSYKETSHLRAGLLVGKGSNVNGLDSHTEQLRTRLEFRLNKRTSVAKSIREQMCLQLERKFEAVKSWRDGFSPAIDEMEAFRCPTSTRRHADDFADLTGEASVDAVRLQETLSLDAQIRGKVCIRSTTVACGKVAR
jgi:hypothetical protein